VAIKVSEKMSLAEIEKERLRQRETRIEEIMELIAELEKPETVKEVL
jgi:hypothetical protein